jgi:hypothetical protein
MRKDIAVVVPQDVIDRWQLPALVALSIVALVVVVVFLVAIRRHRRSSNTY